MSATPAPGTPIAYVDPVRRARVRAKARRDALISTLSLIAFILVCTLLVGSSPGWPTVQQTFFNLDEFSRSFPELLDAFLLNVRIFLIAEPLILILGLLVA
ncbi:MAG: amino acid ABC transporter permease, partial [Actinomycetales bacterium]